MNGWKNWKDCGWVLMIYSGWPLAVKRWGSGVNWSAYLGQLEDQHWWNCSAYNIIDAEQSLCQMSPKATELQEYALEVRRNHLKWYHDGDVFLNCLMTPEMRLRSIPLSPWVRNNLMEALRRKGDVYGFLKFCHSFTDSFSRERKNSHQCSIQCYAA